MFRALVFTICIFQTSTAAYAHSNMLPHTHPHGTADWVTTMALAVSTSLVIVVAAVLIAAARRASRQVVRRGRQ